MLVSWLSHSPLVLALNLIPCILVLMEGGDVGFDIGLLSESFPAVGVSASIGLLSGVDPQVYCQIIIKRETLSTVAAFKRLFPRMD